MDVHPRYEELVEGLLEQSKAGKLRWEPTVSDDEFVASIRGEYSVTLGRRYERDVRDEYIFLSLRDEFDRELSRIYSDDIRNASAVEKLVSLYDLARRQALKVEERVDDLLGKLRVL